MPPLSRVAILSPIPPAGRAGGVEVFTRQLAAALGGAEVFAPAETPSGAPSAWAHLGLEAPRQAVRPARALREAHRREPFDVIVSNGLCGWPLTLAPLPVPMVQVYHFTLAGLACQALRRRGDRFTTRRIGGFFDRMAGVGKVVVAVSDSVRREVAAHYGHRATVLPNGVDVGLFRPGDRGDAREQLHLPPDARIVLFVGRPEYAKGFDLLQELTTSMDDMLFLCASRPVPGSARLEFRGDVPHDRMPLLYRAADVFVLPSRYEGFNLSLLEALACGLPAVTTAAAYPFARDAPVLASVVDPPTAAGFAQALRTAADRGPRAEIREWIAREHSLDAFRARWDRFVRGLAQPDSRRAARPPAYGS